MSKSSKLFTFIVILVLLLIAGAAAYWYYLFYVPSRTNSSVSASGQNNNGFVPLDRGNIPNASGTGANGAGTGSSNSSGNSAGQGTNTANTGGTSGTSSKIPSVRLLSETPVGGFGIMTLGTSTVIRWVDRGRGNIYETAGSISAVTTLSNTLVPRIYRSWWNSTLTTLFAQYITDTSDTITTVIANILRSTQSATSKAATTSQISETPFQLKGKLISGDIIDAAVSPKGDRILTVSNENGRAIGYISKFDGTGQTQLFSVPMTQMTVDWPEENTVAIMTKASAFYPGFLYFVNVKTGGMKEILGNVTGLSAKVSKDASKVFYSRTGTGNTYVADAVLDVKTGKTTDVIFRALADACTWSVKDKQSIYCAVSSQFTAGTYPDDWYNGRVSFVDNVWALNTSNNMAHQVANLLKEGNTLIDAYNLQTDKNDEYLVFMNKNDLSLWSLDLTASK